jgi:hypothetical protein
VRYTLKVGECSLLIALMDGQPPRLLLAERRCTAYDGTASQEDLR